MEYPLERDLDFMKNEKPGKTSSRNWATPVLLAAIPILAVFGYIISTNITFEESRKEAAAMERWLDGSPKVLSREWRDGKDHYAEFRHLDPKGKEWGCGITRNDKQWSGIFVEWYWYNKEHPDPEQAYGIPRHTISYKDGVPHGPWRTYYEIGTVSSEIMYENGKREYWKIFGPSGIEIRKGKPYEAPENEKRNP